MKIGWVFHRFAVVFVDNVDKTVENFANLLTERKKSLPGRLIWDLAAEAGPSTERSKLWISAWIIVQSSISASQAAYASSSLGLRASARTCFSRSRT